MAVLSEAFISHLVPDIEGLRLLVDGLGTPNWLRRRLAASLVVSQAVREIADDVDHPEFLRSNGAARAFRRRGAAIYQLDGETAAAATLFKSQLISRGLPPDDAEAAGAAVALAARSGFAVVSDSEKVEALAAFWKVPCYRPRDLVLARTRATLTTHSGWTAYGRAGLPRPQRGEPRTERAFNDQVQARGLIWTTKGLVDSSLYPTFGRTYSPGPAPSFALSPQVAANAASAGLLEMIRARSSQLIHVDRTPDILFAPNTVSKNLQRDSASSRFTVVDDSHMPVEELLWLAQQVHPTTTREDCIVALAADETMAVVADEGVDYDIQKWLAEEVAAMTDCPAAKVVPTIAWVEALTAFAPVKVGWWQKIQTYKARVGPAGAPTRLSLAEFGDFATGLDADAFDVDVVGPLDHLKRTPHVPWVRVTRRMPDGPLFYADSNFFKGLLRLQAARPQAAATIEQFLGGRLVLAAVNNRALKDDSEFDALTNAHPFGLPEKSGEQFREVNALQRAILDQRGLLKREHYLESVAPDRLRSECVLAALVTTDPKSDSWLVLRDPSGVADIKTRTETLAQKPGGCHTIDYPTLFQAMARGRNLAEQTELFNAVQQFWTFGLEGEFRYSFSHFQRAPLAAQAHVPEIPLPSI